MWYIFFFEHIHLHRECAVDCNARIEEPAPECIRSGLFVIIGLGFASCIG